jgi:hypothetical protein
VGVEAGCGGTVAPLGPPQATAGMTFIRLALARPVVCSTVQLRLYRPRDSSNMGLLQLRLLVAPAFSPLAAPQPQPQPHALLVPPSVLFNYSYIQMGNAFGVWNRRLCTYSRENCQKQQFKTP